MSIYIDDPYCIASYVTEPCHTRTALPVVQAIVEPTPAADLATTAGRIHYANVDPSYVVAPADQHRHGPYIRFKARVAWNAATCTDDLRGQQVAWTFTAQGGNLGAPPSYLGRKASTSVGFSWWNMAVSTVTTSVGDNGLTDEVWFYVGGIGGNGFTVTATSVENGASSVTTGVYTVWRLIPLRCTYTAAYKARAAQPALSIQEINQFFNPAFIEVVAAPDSSVYTRWAHIIAKQYDTGYGGQQTTLTVTLTNATPYLDAGNFRRLTKKGWFHPGSTYQIGTGTPITLPATCVTAVPLTSHSDGLPHPGVPANADDYLDDTVYTTEQIITATTGSGADRIRIMDWKLRSRVRIDLSGIGVVPTATAPVTVNVILQHEHYTSGDGIGTPAVAYGYMLDMMTLAAATTVAAVCATHELAHKLAMYPTGGPHYDAVHTSGGHCDQNTCNMYWKWMEGALKNGFCAACIDLLRQTNIGALSLSTSATP